MRGLTIPFEVADGITLACLQDQREYLKTELKQHIEEGRWMHPEDATKSHQLLYALDLLIDYYGG